MDVLNLLYQKALTHPDCGLQPYLDDFDDVPYFLHLPNLRAEDCDVAGYCAADDDTADDVGDEDSGDGDDDYPNPSSTDIPSSTMGPSTNSFASCKGDSNSRTDHSNHSTSYTKVPLQHPTFRTSRLYTLVQPTPYRPKP